MFGNERSVLGYDVEQQDYYGLFNNTYDRELVIEEARKRVMRYTKDELIKMFQRVMLFIATYYDVKSAYDALTGAMDFLENDGETKSEEITRNFEHLYKKLQYYPKIFRDFNTVITARIKYTVCRETEIEFDKEVESFPQMWWCV